MGKRTVIIPKRSQYRYGGWDPGKVGDSGTLEKDINLLIAENLQEFLEQGGSYVILTRAGDEALADKKNADLDSRSKMADESKADLFISIHQNSYPEEYVKGAQTFYYGDSEKSKQLAEMIQNQVRAYLDTENRREAKANSDYYLLKKTSTPAVIVECGFLSNGTEAQKLTQQEYQQKVAWAIYMGVVNYFGTNTDAADTVE